jgi:hypothetical protein
MVNVEHIIYSAMLSPLVQTWRLVVVAGGVSRVESTSRLPPLPHGLLYAIRYRLVDAVTMYERAI